MQRIYLPNTDFSEILEISEKDLYHQLTRVLRARVGQEVIFFDGEKNEDIVYEMIHIDKKSVSFKRKNIIGKSSDLKTEMTLYQAYPNKLSKFETIVQKCCEVGYRRIVFFESERSQKLVISDNKKQRLQKIAIEAIEQCGGNKIPELVYFAAPFSFERERIQERVSQGEEFFLCHTSGDDAISLSDISIPEKCNVIVGPEGGFSPDEIEKISAQKVFFGERILRCETVGEVVGFYLSQKKES